VRRGTAARVGFILCAFGAAAIRAESAATTDEPALSAPVASDHAGRVLAPVLVNGQGPFRFIVDTGASRSVIAPRLAKALGLVPDPAQPIVLQGVTGTMPVPAIAIRELRAGDTVLRNLRAPVIDSTVFADADGILGVDGFANMCLSVDFEADQVTITRKGCPRRGRGWAQARGRLIFGQLLVVAARIGEIPVRAIIDTGAERSLGNPALLHGLQSRVRRGEPPRPAEVVGATEHRVDGLLVESPEVRLGTIRIGNLTVAFGDLSVFGSWGFTAEPAIVLGMDILGTAAAFQIDYRRGELAVLPRHAMREPPDVEWPPRPSRIG